MHPANKPTTRSFFFSGWQFKGEVKVLSNGIFQTQEGVYYENYEAILKEIAKMAGATLDTFYFASFIPLP